MKGIENMSETYLVVQCWPMEYENCLEVIYANVPKFLDGINLFEICLN